MSSRAQPLAHSELKRVAKTASALLSVANPGAVQ